MAVFMGAFPVMAGKEDEARKFAKETMDREPEFRASQERSGVTREEWSFQQTPMGSFMIVRFDSPDTATVFSNFGQSDDPFDVWSRERIREITGIDLATPPDGPLPEIVLDWTA